MNADLRVKMLAYADRLEQEARSSDHARARAGRVKRIEAYGEATRRGRVEVKRAVASEIREIVAKDGA